MTTRLYFAIIGLFFLAAILCFAGLSQRPLSLWDEQTNRTVVSEFVTRPQFSVLTLHGKPFFEKPPLWYWLTGVSVRIFGMNNFSIRLISALSGFLLIIALWICSNKLYSQKSGFISVLFLLATSQLFVTNPGGYFSTHTLRSADPDGLFLLLFGVASFLSIPAVSGSVRALYALGAISGLAVLTKGPLGLVPLVLALFWKRADRKVPLGHIIGAVCLAALIIIPWHVFMFHQFGSTFIRSYFSYHIWERLIMPLEGHVHPWWYYFSILSSPSVSPGSIWTAVAIYVLFRHGNISTDPRRDLPLVIAASVLGIVFAARTSLAWYILPIYPPIALITGGGLTRMQKEIRTLFPLAVVMLTACAVYTFLEVV